MSNPLIGITTYHGVNDDGVPSLMLLKPYVTAVVEAGGVPVLIPSELQADRWQSIYEHLNGILFSGGGDIAIEHFDGSPHPTVSNVDTERDILELMMLRKAVENGKPFFGICRGFQLVNVALGGKLYTHIADQHPNALRHDYYPEYPRNYLAHTVNVTEDSCLAGMMGKRRLQVNSLHHQGVSEVSSALKVASVAPDGLVEAVELPGHPFGLAVQWHPECLSDQPCMQALFKAFVNNAGNLPRKRNR